MHLWVHIWLCWNRPADDAERRHLRERELVRMSSMADILPPQSVVPKYSEVGSQSFLARRLCIPRWWNTGFVKSSCFGTISLKQVLLVFLPYSPCLDLETGPPLFWDFVDLCNWEPVRQRWCHSVTLVDTLKRVISTSYIRVFSSSNDHLNLTRRMEG